MAPDLHAALCAMIGGAISASPLTRSRAWAAACELLPSHVHGRQRVSAAAMRMADAVIAADDLGPALIDVHELRN